MIRFVTGSLLMAALFMLAGNATPQTKEKPLVMQQATGKFSVKMLPPPAAGDSSFVRLLIEKEFEGPLQGKSQVEMLASNAGDKSAGGYVALERFTGKLSGREGSFIMQHSGTMSPAGTNIQVLVTPGSGTDALAGIEGMLAIRMEGKQHYYDLSYKLPE
jgi:hypothetical protein